MKIRRKIGFNKLSVPNPTGLAAHRFCLTTCCKERKQGVGCQVSDQLLAAEAASLTKMKRWSGEVSYEASKVLNSET